MSSSLQHSHASSPKPWSLKFVDDILQQRAAEDKSSPIVAFPESGEDPTRSRIYTAGELDHYVDAVASYFAEQGLGPAVEDVPPIIGILGLTSLSYLVTMHAFLRLGYTTFLLSPRLSVDAYASLLEKTNCNVLVYPQAQASIVSEIESRRDVSAFSMHSTTELQTAAKTLQTKLDFELNPASATKRVAFILHSSGSTGLPKPIYQTHSAMISGMGVGYGGRCLNTCPLFHFHGLGMLHRTWFKRGTTFYPNFHTPLTSSTLLALLEKIKPTALFAVPYTLKLAAEKEHSLDILSACEVVTTSGSACPDELGDLLTQKGVHLVSICGTSETGPVLISNRERGDPTWNYLRVVPPARQYVWWKPITEDTYEFVALDGMKTLVTTNSDDPPRSYHSRDLWTPHPTKQDAWKYLGRLDDRVTLANGEKVLPLPIEGRVRQDPLVKEAAVFGIGKDIPGLLLFRSIAARELSNEDFIDRVWPSVEDANSRAQAFEQIGRDMIVPVSADRTFAQTDKLTIIRAKVYLEFAEVIDKAYDDSVANDEAFDETESLGDLTERLFDLLYGPSGIFDATEGASAESDLFNAGLDSLKAIQLSRVIRQRLIPPSKRGQIRMDQNVIYEHSNIKRLAAYLEDQLNSRAGQTNRDGQNTAQDVTEKMQELVDKYSTPFSVPTSAVAPLPGSKYGVVLTGSTGSLGSHIVTALLSMAYVDRIYCLLRPSSLPDPYQQVIPAAHGKKNIIDAIHSRVRFLKADITSGADLGLNQQDLDTLRSDVKLIIHCGWAVNFNIPLESFGPLLEGTANLLKFCKGLERSKSHPEVRPKFVFISSISVGLGAGSRANGMSEEASRNIIASDAKLAVQVVPEAALMDLESAQKTGYGRSKLCAEHIIAAAATHRASIDTRILRIGQVVGDKNGCLWNANESIPLMLRTATTIGALPKINDMCKWMPVDVVADAVMELASREACTSERSTQYYNVVNNVTPFHWTNDLMPALGEAGLDFRGVSPIEWLRLLKEQLKTVSENQGTFDDPSMKLTDFWERRYGGTKVDDNGGNKVDVRFDTKLAEECSQAMREKMPDLIQEGYISGFLEGWKDVWRQSVT